MKRKPKAQLFDDDDRQEILDLLPVAVSEIRVQIRDATRVSVFANDDFLLGLPVHVCNRLGLVKGCIIDTHLFRQIEGEVQRDAIRSWLLGLLAKKPYARSQLVRKCREAGYDMQVTDAILDDFASRKWIDDEAFASSFARDKATFQRWGPAKIRQQLRLLGIPDRVAEDAVKQNLPAEDQRVVIRNLVMKRKLHFLREENPQKRKKKIVDYLLRKGYDADNIFGSIDAVIRELNT
ncbi:MAG: putative RecA regulatory protein RecX [Bacteroidetes bacterium HLUCCA01]|nr:MAG: putative RecA regulatory protein RecX [Bacteroidetes bacterium HLUCCA01]